MSNKVLFVTGNSRKLTIARGSLAKFDIEVEQLVMETPEIQSTDTEEVAKYSVKFAADKTGKTVLKADFGMCIPCLKGFPGPFVKYINQWLTAEQFAGLYKNSNDRQAYFVDALGYCEPGGEPICFTTNTLGKLIDDPRGENGNMVDSLFVPEGLTKTIAQLDEAETAELWSNDRFTRLAEFLKGR